MPEHTDNPFSSFDPEVPVPLSPAEIRHRGDLRRRRTTGLAVAGAVAAIVLIAAPVAVLSGGDDRAGLPVATQTPTDTAPTADAAPLDDTDVLAPSDLPARERLADWTGVDPGTEPVLRCFPVPYSVPSIASAAEAIPAPDPSVTKPSSTPIARMRTVVHQFADADAASGAYAEVATALSTCAERIDVSAGKGRDRGSFAGAEHVEWQLFTYGDPELCTECDGAWFDRMGVAQVGDRLLLLSYAVAGGPLQPEGLEADMRDLVRIAVDRAAPGPTTTTETGSPTAPPPTEDVSDFELAQGWPADSETEPGGDFGLTGPSTSIGAFDYSVCSTPLPLDDVHGSLRATWTNVEDSRSRELLTFADAQAAVAFMDRARDFYSGCPEEVGSDGYTSVHEVLPTEVGGQSFAAVNTWRFDEAPAIGLEVLHFIRLGRAVVIDTTSGEGSRTGAPAVIDEMSRATAQVVVDLCRFTDAGC